MGESKLESAVIATCLTILGGVALGIKAVEGANAWVKWQSRKQGP
jgi:hypothetical protein